jgi:hypothetical protein
LAGLTIPNERDIHPVAVESWPRTGNRPTGAPIEGHGAATARGPLTAAASALVFGWLGWRTSHALSARLFDHLHTGGAEAAAWSRDGLAGTVGLIVCCLALGSLVAVLSSGTRVPAPTARMASVLAAGAFVTADFAERVLAGDHAVPSALVLGIAVGVHTLFAAVASLLWHSCISALLGTRTAIEDDRRPSAAHRAAAPLERQELPASHHTGSICEGRAPPGAAA